MADATESRSAERRAFIRNVHGIRYRTSDVGRAVAFYTQHVGFNWNTMEHLEIV